MIEYYRTGLLWKLFMSIPEIQGGLKKLEFESPWDEVRKMNIRVAIAKDIV